MENFSVSFFLWQNLSMAQTIKIRSTKREEMIDITAEVTRMLRESEAKEGIVVLFVQHTTCGLTVNENADPDVQTDILSALRKLIPQHGMNFKHAEENSDAHLKSSFFGSSVTIPFSDGELLLGRWQGIYLCEFDGARERKIVMMIK
jgi:secondary thiamine-phosphate synthase enzyme